MESINRYFWRIFWGGIGMVVLLFALIAMGAMGYMPSFDELENPNSSLSTEIISTDGKIIGKYYVENRSNIEYANINKQLKNALLATEDIRFYQHTGIDIRALMRVVKGLIGSDYAGGGSTITQQLAKNLFPRKRRNKLMLVLQKFKEWVIAVKLERAYTKDEIMAMYLNTVPFSDNAYGIKSAAYVYFGKPVDSLRLEEAAVLVGMLKAPSTYNPRLHPEASLKRRNVVIDQMYHYGFITKAERDSLFKLPIRLDYHPDTHTEGEAPYFREFLRLWLKDWCEKNPKPDGTKYNIYKDGLRVYVTIDSRMQRYAEEAQQEYLREMQKIFFNFWKGKDPWRDFQKEWDAIYKQCPRYIALKRQGKSDAEIDAELKKPIPMRIFSYEGGEKDTVMSVYDSIRYHRMILQNGFVAVDPESGYVRAWVGGVNYKYFQYDHVNWNTRRQIGSTFKPFVYTVAIRDKGYSPCFRVPNMPVTFEAGDPRFGLVQDWTPKNSDGRYGGMLTLRQGLQNSVNTVTAYLMHEMTPEAVAKLVKSMGVKSPIPLQPSICLGSADISLIEMVGAYTTYANKGVHVEPIFVTRIEDRHGNVLQDFVAPRNEALDEETAYVMVELLRHVVLGGTGMRIRYRYRLMNDIAGKTGTTQNYSDGWFIGFTPDLVAGSWVGCEDRYIRFRNMYYGQGASTALPIWAKFFQKIYADSANLRSIVDPNRKFEPPAGKMTIELDCGRYSGGYKFEPGTEYE
ncbi:MAG: transglycosylase domain-containing protein [Chitinophagales bacterium]|nr:transglycosylase domain-containing protein [Chitinophagales bacterium]MDW8419770.1 transglycosylase domain-containing protein [Chitinophagales bacterium]